jgi:hypothetical protein
MAYQFRHISGDPASFSAVFDLYENDVFLIRIRRNNLREDLRNAGRGENWIGSILRILDKQFPLSVKPSAPSVPSDKDIFRRRGNDGLAEYLRSKGFRVFKRLSVPDRQIIEHLENEGYCIEGLVDDVYYRSPALIINEMAKNLNNDFERRL